ncbi:uncharacterized protein C7orf78 homolog [Diretmus argenteus]
MTQSSRLDLLPSVSFERKALFSAGRDLAAARSKWVLLPESETRVDVWSIKTWRRMDRVLPKVLLQHHKRTDPAKFIATFRPPDALESKLMFVKTGKYPVGPYKNPKPHDFRPLDEDLPHVSTTAERDPGNLDFKSKRLDIIGTKSQPDFSSRDSMMRMDTSKPAEPRWEAGLVLPKLPWPPKSASYTRHRRRRGVYSAFMDRVEEKLARSWENR